MNMQEFRAKYPAYDSKSDTELVEALHKKYYSKMPIEEVYTKMGVKPMSVGDTALDVGISAGSGVTKGVGETLALPARAASGARWLADKAGMKEGYNEFTKAAKMIPGVSIPLSASQAVRDEIDTPQTALGRYVNYKPETTGGEYAKTTGEFTINAVGPKAGALTRFGKYALAPALASETAGQATEGTKYEPYARGAGALLGAGAGALALNSRAESAYKAALTSADEVEKLGNAAFNKAKTAGIYLKPQTMDGIAQRLDDHLADRKGVAWIPGTTPKATQVFDYINKTILTQSRGIGWAGAPQTQRVVGNRPIGFEELDAIIQTLGKQAKALPYTEKNEARILYAAKHFLEDEVQKLDVPDVWGGSGGNLKDIQGTIVNAKKYWTKKSKLDLLDQMEEGAENTGKARFTRGGIEHATRNEYLKFLRKDPNKRQRLTADELKAFQRVDRGTGTGNFFRGVGTNLGGGALGGLGGWALGSYPGFMVGGPLGAIIGGSAALGTGGLARTLAKRSTLRASTDARALIAGDGKKQPRGYISNLGRLLLGARATGN